MATIEQVRMYLGATSDTVPDDFIRRIIQLFPRDHAASIADEIRYRMDVKSDAQRQEIAVNKSDSSE